MKNKKGFTLAEVLITLGIIGVVAAMTIPTLMANNQKTQYVTSLKKAYTEVNQALAQMATDNGCVGDLVCTGLFDTDKDNQSLGDEFVKYFKVVKNCETTTAGCFSGSVSHYYDGSDSRNSYDGVGENYGFITSDGMTFRVNSFASNCIDQGVSISGNGPMSQFCGYLIVDINGLKGPNNFGRDIFKFWITNGKGIFLYPVGGGDDGMEGVWKDSSGNLQGCYDGNHDTRYGTYCAGRIIEEGWKMDY